MYVCSTGIFHSSNIETANTPDAIQFKVEVDPVSPSFLGIEPLPRHAIRR